MTSLYVQDRSRATRMRLASAFAKLLETHSYDEIGIKEITEQAKCSVGVFYRHYNDKLDLLGALFERYFEERGNMRFTYLAPENWKGLNLEGTVKKLVRTTLQNYRERAGLFDAFSQLPDADSDHGSHMGVLYAGIEEILAPHLDHLEDPREAACFAFFLITSSAQMSSIQKGRHARFLDFTPAQLELHLTRTLLAYLKL